MTIQTMVVVVVIAVDYTRIMMLHGHITVMIKVFLLVIITKKIM